MYMFKPLYRIVGIAFMLFVCGACNSTVGEDVVARAYGNYLREADLQGLLQPGMTKEDSVAVVNNYINQWLQQQVVLHKAEKNVAANFQEQLQNYKNNLLTYEYERQVIAQLLDTNVSNEEIQQYYDSHRDDFLLKSNIVRAIYVKVNAASPSVARLKKLMSKKKLDDNDMQDLQHIAASHGVDYYFEEDTWMPFQKLQTMVPVETYNEVAFLKNNSKITISDSLWMYVVHILDYKVVDETSPLEYEYDHIRTVILNSRKIDIIENMQRDLLEKAELNDDIERYR